MSTEPIAYRDAQPLRLVVAPQRRAWTRGATARALSSTLLAGVVLVILVTIAGMLLGAWRFSVIDTGSMRPTLNPGDVAVLTPEPTTALKRGQIVAFHPPGEPKLTVIHRVVSIHRVSNGVIIQTKGDANNAADQWRARIIGNTVWRERLKAQKVGYLAAWSQRRPVRFGLLIIIVTLVVSMMLGSIWRSTQQ
ncbi:MAG TPA: signal peptidase I [Solirubrobacteraceae bacterium]|jgi:signal peptidase|nr:signal peptidase I [Solirubrobacteraceae bacterium]